MSQMILRTADDFKFKITGIHHASETWRMIDQLAKHKPMSLALFASDGAFKPVSVSRCL